MYKLIVPLLIFFSSRTNAQSVMTLEDTSKDKMTVSVLKSDSLMVDQILISGTYYGNETKNAVVYSPEWKKNKMDVQQSTFEFMLSPFDMSKSFKVILAYNGRDVKTYRSIKGAQINGMILRRYR